MNKRNGFTLIEMMIVVAIIGILVAIIIPAVTGHTAGVENNPAIEYTGKQ